MFSVSTLWEEEGEKLEFGVPGIREHRGGSQVPGRERSRVGLTGQDVLVGDWQGL